MPRQPIIVREARALIALASETLTALAAEHLERGADQLAPAPAPEVMLVRHLGLEHLGRWIYLPGRPAAGGPKVAQEPTVVAVAGRLVGIRAGKIGTNDQPGTRGLVLLQGPASAELSVSVADRVDVAPREW